MDGIWMNFAAQRQPTEFVPLESNGGTVVGIAGKDFAILAADTRLTSGYTVQTRNQDRIFKMTEKLLFGTAGSWADGLTVAKLLRMQVIDYQLTHRRVISAESFANMLSIFMYSRRMYPFYIYNVIAGLDKEGKGAVWSFDALGHTERAAYAASGVAGSMMEPILDSVVGGDSMYGQEQVKVSLKEAVKLATDTFVSATERNILTGDSVIINIVTKDGIEEKKVELRKD